MPFLRVFGEIEFFVFFFASNSTLVLFCKIGIVNVEYVLTTSNTGRRKRA